MKKHLISMALVCVAGLLVSAASSACDFSFKGIHQDNQRPYSMFSPGVNVIELRVTVELTDCLDLNFMFESASNNALTGSGGRIYYQLKGVSGRNIMANGLFAVPAQDLMTSRSDPSLVIRAFVEPGSFAGPGRYTDQLTLKASNGHSIIEVIEFPLTLQVNPEADIALAGLSSNGYSAMGGGGMSFGQLESGKETSAFLFVRSNVSYALNISSRNQGHLVHRQETGDRALIPYSAWLDNEPLKLASPTRVQDNGMTPISRSRPHRLSARIEHFADKLAGDYQDVILVEVVFLE